LKRSTLPSTFPLNAFNLIKNKVEWTFVRFKEFLLFIKVFETTRIAFNLIFNKVESIQGEG